MSTESVKKVLTSFLKRFKNNTENRKYLDTKPHAVIISKEYLRAIGLSENAIEYVYAKTRIYITNVNKNNTGPAQFREDIGVVYFLSPGESSNFAKAGVIRKFVSEAAKNIDNLDILFETGHTLTANVTESAYTKTQRLRNVAAKKSVLAAYADAVHKYRTKVLEKFSSTYGLDIDVDFLREQVKGKTSSQFLVLITPQTKDFNQRIIGALEAEFKSTFFGDVLAEMKGSPSILDLIEDSLEDAFLGRPLKNITLSTRSRAKIIPKVVKSIESPKLKDSRSSLEDLNIIRLQTLINLKLHDQIRINMGKGRSRNVLNYRTGRFAKSAEAQAVIQNRQDMVDIYYTYQRDPYDTFLPGGRLYKPGRDPRKIIGRSIRQLATEFVGNNFKVNPILRGKV